MEKVDKIERGVGESDRGAWDHFQQIIFENCLFIHDIFIKWNHILIDIYYNDFSYAQDNHVK